MSREVDKITIQRQDDIMVKQKTPIRRHTFCLTLGNIFVFPCGGICHESRISKNIKIMEKSKQQRIIGALLNNTPIYLKEIDQRDCCLKCFGDGR